MGRAAAWGNDGFENILLTDIIEPGRTTVAAPVHAHGMTDLRNLLALIGGAVPRRGPFVRVNLAVRG
jgi:hypothetical protein